jgi:hypothetical protein
MQQQYTPAAMRSVYTPAAIRCAGFSDDFLQQRCAAVKVLVVVPVGDAAVEIQRLYGVQVGKQAWVEYGV